jgi:alpha-amylase/alpha-mannosidase (GH57 family)
MRPLKIAILWHFHQPYYKKDDTLILPWVRLHGVKDYWDLPELFHEYPNVRQTINLVPSMQMQVEEYVVRSTSDRVQQLTAIKASSLSEKDKKEILDSFFLCNEENMIRPYPRYSELFEQSRNKDEALSNFTEQDWLDLQVWYNLTWFGQISRKRPAINRLFRKERGYTESEKEIVMQMHLNVLSQIVPQLDMLQDMGQIEVSVSPMYHPILPLLCDSESALEAMQGAEMPDKLFKYPEDAIYHVKEAMKYSEDILHKKATGMWPSEGSVSNKALEIMADAGVKWFASDEKVLANSVGNSYDHLDKYFPRKIKTKAGYIAGLFRDVRLSDAIGFEYSRWNHFDAVNDFMHRLRHIKSELVNNKGEECIDHAVVPIILDGENCWEFYANNGEFFLREFFHQLESMSDFETVTCSQAVAEDHLNYLPEIDDIKAGSWINGDFHIWIGHEEHRRAWSLLSDIREIIEKKKGDLSSDDLKKVMREIYIAEGSDWFWWYGDTHQAPNKPDFDVLFRWHLRKAYSIIGEKHPEELDSPISEYAPSAGLVEQSGDIHPEINGIVNPENEWENAGFYDAATSMGAMHQIGEVLNRFWFAGSNKKVYFRFDLKSPLAYFDSVTLNIKSPKKMDIVMLSSGLRFFSEHKISNIEYAYKDVMELSFDKDCFTDSDDNFQIELSITTHTQDGEITYPRQRTIKIEMG